MQAVQWRSTTAPGESADSGKRHGLVMRMLHLNVGIPFHVMSHVMDVLHPPRCRAGWRKPWGRPRSVWRNVCRRSRKWWVDLEIEVKKQKQKTTLTMSHHLFTLMTFTWCYSQLHFPPRSGAPLLCIMIHRNQVVCHLFVCFAESCTSTRGWPERSPITAPKRRGRGGRFWPGR